MNEDTSQAVEVLFYPIDFGMLGIDCPNCNAECTGVFVGMTTVEDEYEPETVDGLANLVQMGVVQYPCGHIFVSPCLTDKIARILNDRENNELRLEAFVNLIECDEHGDHESDG